MSRFSDEDMLRALAMRDDGKTYAEIAEVLGCDPHPLRVVVGRVKRADAKAHGEK